MLSRTAFSMSHPEAGTVPVIFNCVNRKHTHHVPGKLRPGSHSPLMSSELGGGRRRFPAASTTSAKTKGASNWKQTWPCLMAWTEAGRTDTSLNHTEEGEVSSPSLGLSSYRTGPHRSQPWAGCRGNCASRSSPMQPQFFTWPEWVSHPHAPSTGGHGGNASASPKPKSWKEQRAHHSCLYSSNYKQPRAWGAEPSADIGLILLEVASGMLETVTCPRTCAVCFHFQTLWAYVKFESENLDTSHATRTACFWEALVGPSWLLQNVLNFANSLSCY